ncbi:hypothetical protein RP20_CCG024948 [Aedes albopictus]|nr:hypothetical protein RP20_CCG024948 [Aedes albopictus]
MAMKTIQTPSSHSQMDRKYLRFRRLDDDCCCSQTTPADMEWRQDGDVCLFDTDIITPLCIGSNMHRCSVHHSSSRPHQSRTDGRRLLCLLVLVCW